MQIEKGKVEQEINPELIKEIEESDFDILSKVNFLLVLAGLKPGSEMSFGFKEGEGGKLEPKMKTQEQLQRNILIVERSGIFYKEINSGELYCHILIGHTQADLEAVVLADKKLYDLAPMTSKDHQMSGSAYGFPPSAVQACSEQGAAGMLDESQLSAEEKKEYSDALAFKTYMLSKNDWKKELEISQGYAGFIKKNKPQTL